jgi:hypothetical protein
MADKCSGCGIPIPTLPEDATFDEKLCDTCLAKIVTIEPSDYDPDRGMSTFDVSNDNGTLFHGTRDECVAYCTTKELTIEEK